MLAAVVRNNRKITCSCSRWRRSSIALESIQNGTLDIQTQCLQRFDATQSHTNREITLTRPDIDPKHVLSLHQQPRCHTHYHQALPSTTMEHILQA